MKKANYLKVKTFILSLFMIAAFFSCKNEDSKEASANKNEETIIPISLVIHGGAGEIKPGFLSPEQEDEYRLKLSEALNVGYQILKKGGNSIDAVEATIHLLEDSPLFNAGKGSVLTHEGEVSMDASIMKGEDLNAGAASGIKNIKNPIGLARLVMDSSRHVFLSGQGAENFASKYNLETGEKEYFIIPKRMDQLKKKLGKDSVKLSSNELEPGDKYGTVGCVAIDVNGNIAAGTSTGGMVNKQWGRIGDSPIIGAGTYADNESCGISATGHGEYFIRIGVAKGISDLMKYGNYSIAEACKEVIQNQLGNLGGTGGVIAIDKSGDHHFEFNTPGMYRGVKSENVEEVFFYGN